MEAITAEAEAERPTRRRRTTKADEGRVTPAAVEETDTVVADEEEPAEPVVAVADEEEPAEPVVEPVDAVADEEEPADEAAEATADGAGAAKPKRKTRRGSRGGRNRRKKPAAAGAAADAPAGDDGELEAPTEEAAPTKKGASRGGARGGAREASTEEAASTKKGASRGGARIHLPPVELGDEVDAASNGGARPAPKEPKPAREPGGGPEEETGAEPVADAAGDEPVAEAEGGEAEQPKPKRKTRRGTRGGRNRRRRTTPAADGGTETAASAVDTQASE